MNLDMTGRAISVLGVLVVLRSSRLNCPHVMGHAVTSQAELIDLTESQQPRVSRAVWRVTCHATLSFQRCMFVGERTLLVRVTLYASRIATGGESCLFQFETAVWVMTIAALHCAFQNLMMERHIERWLHFTMTTRTKLRFSDLQHAQCCKAGLFRICGCYTRNRARHILISGRQVWRVAITATDIVAPVFAATKVVVLFFAGMAAETGLSNFFGRLVLERDDLLRIAFLGMRFTRSMTGFATRHLSFPAAYLGKLSV